MQRTTRLGVLLLASVIFSNPLSAATNGDQAVVKVSGLNDIALIVRSDGGASGSTTACIYRNGTGSYMVTANGSGVANAFTLSDGNSGVIPYSVTFDDGNGAEPLTKDTTLTGLTGANTLSMNCNGGTNATIDVAVSATDFIGAPAGDYTGTLTLIIAPE